MKVLIATTQVPFIYGGAEVLANTLRDACVQAGHEVEIVSIPFKHYPTEFILDQMLACRLLDLTESLEHKVDRLIGLKFPAYLAPHPKKSFWLLHQYRGAYDLWGTEYSDLMHNPFGPKVRSAIINADNKAFEESRGSIYTISKNVSQRLEKHNGVASRPLYPPPQSASSFYTGGDAGYLFFPSRITVIKRQELVIRALAKTVNPVKVIFAGKADREVFVRKLEALSHELGVADRVTFLGPISEETKFSLYAEATAVVYPPLDEDYGYVTLEAMLASKAVITCRDSGGPLEFVQDQITGRVAGSEPSALAAAMDEAWENRDRTRKMGLAARQAYDVSGIGWKTVLDSLLA